MTLQLKQLDPEILKIRPPDRVKHFFIRRDHRKRLLELSQKSVGEIPQLHDPNDEQKEWVIRKMKAPRWAWEVWDK
jgi:hypothetical protein